MRGEEARRGEGLSEYASVKLMLYALKKSFIAKHITSLPTHKHCILCTVVT